MGHKSCRSHQLTGIIVLLTKKLANFAAVFMVVSFIFA